MGGSSFGERTRKSCKEGIIMAATAGTTQLVKIARVEVRQATTPTRLNNLKMCYVLDNNILIYNAIYNKSSLRKEVMADR